ncbi:MAG: alpha-amylase family glycosyl hydrolase [Phycisphaerales bacterium]
MYEVNLRAFSQAGDLDGVTDRLDEIQSLGVNVLWLMPIHPVGQINSAGGLGSPYSVQNYHTVGSEYGTLSDLTTLIDEAHQRGMSVLMDWVANHTAWDHPWITTHPDWYTQDGQGNIIHPAGTNWTDVADLNYNNQAMRSAMISEMQYWVNDVGIDGFRTDTADFVPFSFWQQAITAVRAGTNRDLLMLAEGARNDHYAAGFDLTYGWDFYNAVKSVFNSSSPATLLQQTRASEFAVVPQGKGILQFTTNHDESAWDATPVELFGGLDASLAAYAVTVAYGGTPLVYSGQEIGREELLPFFTRDPLDWNTGQDTAQWYAQLLGARADHIALREGTMTDQSTNDVAMLLRESGDDQVIVLVNTRGQSRQVSIPAGWQGNWIDLMTGQSQSLSAQHTLAPYGVLILGTVPMLTGDINGDGFVGVADLNVILSNWNQTVPVGDKSQGDLAGIGDGFIGVSDLNVVLGNWNAGTPPGVDAPGNVPEPATVLLLGVVTLRTLARPKR